MYIDCIDKCVNRPTKGDVSTGEYQCIRNCVFKWNQTYGIIINEISYIIS